MCFLANLLITGNGVKQNVHQAVELLAQSINEYDDVQAMKQLACLYQEGTNVQKDIPRAIELFSTAVDEGQDTEAMIC